MHATFASFEAAAKQKGFEEVLTKDWAPSLSLDVHSHPFDVEAQVISGDMTLVVEGYPTRLSAGQSFQLAANVPHSEVYGAGGATVWIARRHPKTP